MTRVDLLARATMAMVCWVLAGTCVAALWTEAHVVAATHALDGGSTDRARQLLALASRVPLRGPDYHLQQGRLAVVADESPGQAVAALRTQVEMRPLWPDGHAWLAVAKARARQWDDEFAAAVDNALETGPRRATLLPIFAFGGTRMVLGLEHVQRDRLVQLAAWAGKWYPIQVQSAATKLGIAGAWCAEIRGQRDYGRALAWCDRQYQNQRERQ